MNYNTLTRAWLAALLVAGAVAFPRALLKAQTVHEHDASASAISIVDLPHAAKGGPDQTEPISGKVTGIDVAKYKIVLYAFAGGTWWVQPTVESPLTEIDRKGNWQTITHLGSSYAVLLVSESYKPPATTADVPHVGGDVVAVKLAAGKR